MIPQGRNVYESGTNCSRISATYSFSVQTVAVVPDHSVTYTLGAAPLDEGSASHKSLYLHKIQTYMPPAGVVPAIPTTGRRLTNALDCATTGIGWIKFVYNTFILLFVH